MARDLPARRLRKDQQHKMKAGMKNRKTVSISSFAALMIAGALLAAPAYADKPESAGKGKQKQSRNDRDGKQRDHEDRSKAGSRHFGEQQHVVVREYYVREYRGGHCPPGLAKKNNGCMPPGQAKKWHVGRPLPREVIFYDLPPRLIVDLGAPPAGHRYVRVASDILLIAIGTAMVVDAISDLGRM